MPEPTTSGSARTRLPLPSTTADAPVSDEDANATADAILGPPTESHVTRAYCRDASVTR